MRKKLYLLAILPILLAGCNEGAISTSSSTSSPSSTTSSTSSLVNVYSNDTSKGIVTGGGEYGWGSNVTVKATPIGDYVFNGWYSDSELTRLISKDALYSFEMPAETMNFYAKFWTKAEEEEWNINHDAIPTISSDGKTITYGLYPQTNVSNSSLISKLNTLTIPELNGWYLYDDQYYAKLVAKPNREGYKFDNETTIVKGQTYWFKCEPIKWNILKNDANEYFVLSSVLLDAHRYAVVKNNYKNSEIRAWLNNEFYNSSFALNASFILTTEVDNTAPTTDSTSNPYACENTFDKVFLPSYKDYLNSSYGFSTSNDWDTTRQCKTTDYARANGAYCITSRQKGCYWTRSPYCFGSGDARLVDTGGYIYINYVSDACNCVRPCLSLIIED